MAAMMMVAASSQTAHDAIAAETDPSFTYTGLVALDWNNAKPETEIVACVDKLIERFLQLYGG